jgi:LmbE family N-acetylglucosaminyl deacetylase
MNCISTGLKWTVCAVGFSLRSFLLVAIFIVSSAGASVLVIAPHPDDDVIMASGVVYRALQNGQSARVVFMTNGDYGSIEAGYSRLVEAVNAQSQLGMIENHLLFLGYPDGGLDAIRTGYPALGDTYVSSHGQSVTYGNRGLGRSDYHTYRFGAPAQYNGANITLDLKTIISEFLPEHIFTTCEYDGTSDHTSTYHFLRAALAQLSTENPSYRPTLHKTIVWARNSSTWPNVYDPTAYFSDAIDLSGTPLLWNERESLDVPVLMQSAFYAGNPKYLAAEAHWSQRGASSFLGRWVHKDEVFWVEQAGGSNRPPVVSAGLDQTVAEGATVHLNGGGSFDKDGDALSYEWRQVEGTPVILSSIHSVAPIFVAPAGLAQDELLSFELIASDNTYSSYADAVNIVVRSSTWAPPVYTDITASVTSVSASTVHTTSDVSNLIDGCIDGYSDDGATHDATCEWISNAQRQGAWIQLGWDAPVTVGKIILYDRINRYDQAVQGTIAFSDGTTLQIGLLDNIGRGGEYAFSPRQITSLRYTITSVSSHTSNIGLSEIEVFSASSGAIVNLAPIASASAMPIVTEGAVVQLSGADSSDPNGDLLTYLWLQTGGQAVSLSDTQTVNPIFTAPSGLSADEVLSFELTVNDGLLDSTPALVSITVLADLPGNQSPIANAGSDQTTLEGGQVALDGSASIDPDGDVLTFHWVQSDGQSVVLSDETTVAPTFTAPSGLLNDETLQFTLTVSDGALESAPAIVHITVQKETTPGGLDPDSGDGSGGGSSGCFISSL